MSCGRRMKPGTSSPRAANRIAEAIPLAMSLRVSADRMSPTPRLTPISERYCAPNGSSRVILSSAPVTISRAPASSAVRATISPSRQNAIFVVPPPTSILSTVPNCSDKATAPDPWAAISVSSASPALTATNLPACAAKISPIARALERRAATPVRINAPVSISSGVRPEATYCASMKRAKASASIVLPSA